MAPSVPGDSEGGHSAVLERIYGWFRFQEREGPWRLSKNTTVAKALPEAFFVKTLGLVLPG